MALPPMQHMPSSYQAHPPLPAGLRHGEHFTRTEGFVPSRTGRGKLWYAAFWPVGQRPKGLVTFCHGIHEHSERYHHVLPQLAAQGYVAAAHDHLGHGRSEGVRGHIERLDEFIEDAEEVLAQVRSQIAEPVPIFVWGQSMGGLIVAHMALRDSRKGPGAQLAGTIVTSGALDVIRTPIMKVQELFAPVLLAILAQARLVPAVRPEEMSTDPAEVRRITEDPLTTVTLKLRAKLAVEVSRGMTLILAKAEEIKTPLLVFHGTEDKCTYPPGAQRFVEKAGSADKEFVSLPNAWHCLLHEPRWCPEVVAKMLAFLERRAGSQAAAGPAVAARSRL